MKNRTRILRIISLFALMAALPVHAQFDWQHRVYVKADGGGVVTSDTDVKEIFGPVPAGTEIEFDPGPRFGIALGYNVTDWFATELEFGILANSIKDITGAQSIEGTFLNTPVLVNVKLQLPTGTPFTPYIGIGGGGASSVLDLDHLDYGGMHISGTASDAVYAWQAFGGFRIALNDHMGLGLEYRYFRAGAPTFEGDHGFFSDLPNDHIKFGEIESHVVSFRFDFTF
jgi:OmpA-OmpF porin, OOP family